MRARATGRRHCCRPWRRHLLLSAQQSGRRPGTNCRARRARTSVYRRANFTFHMTESQAVRVVLVPTRASARCAVDHKGSDAVRRDQEAKRHMAAQVEGVEVSGPDVARSDEVLTPEALELVALLHRE